MWARRNSEAASPALSLLSRAAERDASTVERRALHGLEIDERAIVVEHGLQLGVARRRQIALRLDHLEVGRHAGLELLLLGHQLPFGQFPRHAGRVDAL